MAEIALAFLPGAYESAAPLIVFVFVLLLVDLAFHAWEMTRRRYQPWHRPIWPFEGYLVRDSDDEAR